MQCLPLNEGGTQSAGQRCYCVLCPPAQQHTLRFAEDTKDVCSSWPSTVGRVPEGSHKGDHFLAVYIVVCCESHNTHLICMYTIRTHTNTHTHAHTLSLSLSHTHTHTHTHNHTCMHICNTTYTHIHAHSSVPTHQQSTMTEYTSLGQPGGGGRQ